MNREEFNRNRLWFLYFLDKLDKELDIEKRLDTLHELYICGVGDGVADTLQEEQESEEK